MFSCSGVNHKPKVIGKNSRAWKNHGRSEYDKISKIRYSIKGALYSVDENNFEKLNLVKGGKKEIAYSKITLKPIENGFYKYMHICISDCSPQKIPCTHSSNSALSPQDRYRFF